jgi:hypothetical protein
LFANAGNHVAGKKTNSMSFREQRLPCVTSAVLLIAVLAGAVGCSEVGSSDALAIATGGTRGVKAFVLSNTYFAADPGGAQSCPAMSQSSLELLVPMLPASVGEKLRNLSSEEKLRLLSAERARKFGFKMLRINGEAVTTEAQFEQKRRELGIPSGKGSASFLGRAFSYDSCTDPDDFPALRGGLRVYEGPTAAGMNLDGRVDANDYAGVAGQPGIDNELWRAIGCTRIFRETGEPQVAKKIMFSARAPTLIEVSGVDDVRNDAEVTLSVYTSVDPLVVAADGGVLAYASFDIDPNPRLRSSARGQIVNGVLTTEPFDVDLSYKEQIVEASRRLRGARVQATINADGSIEGGFYGYYEVQSFLDSIRQMSQLGADLSGFSCPDLYQTVRDLADGYPDPKSGRNTAISSALHFVGVSAYAIHAAQPSSSSVPSDSATRT